MDVEFYIDKSGEWRWRLVDTAIGAGNVGVLADSGEGYTERLDCEADFVRLVTGLRREANTVVVGEDGGRAIGSLQALVDMHERAHRR